MRWVVDRRAQPSENNGTLTIAGERGEVLKAAVEHAVPSRGHTDSEERGSAIRAREPAQPPHNWISNIPAQPPACARGWRRCLPSPASDIDGRLAEIC